MTGGEEFTWLTALILGCVEGLTEFLPVSSTGHLILAGDWLGFEGEKAGLVEIVIQGAAILAVCWEYRRKLFDTVRDVGTRSEARHFALNVAVAFLPLAIIGLLFGSAIKDALFNPYAVAIALVVGGIVILLVDRGHGSPRIYDTEHMPLWTAAALGFFQALALFPGTSRSAATIVGGRLLGLSRICATEFSFFLAIPTLLAATAYSLFKARHVFEAGDLGPLALSSIVSFLTALVAIRGFIRFVSTHTFAAFAWYRIALGVLVLGWAKFGGWV